MTSARCSSSAMTTLKRKSLDPAAAVLLGHLHAEEAVGAGLRRTARGRRSPSASHCSKLGTTSRSRNERKAERNSSCVSSKSVRLHGRTATNERPRPTVASTRRTTDEEPIPTMTIDDIDSQRASFHAMTEGTALDWGIIAHHNLTFAPGCPTACSPTCACSRATPAGSPSTASSTRCRPRRRAYRGGEDDEYVVCALLHDIGDILGPYNHADIAAAGAQAVRVRRQPLDGRASTASSRATTSSTTSASTATCATSTPATSSTTTARRSASSTTRRRSTPTTTRCRWSSSSPPVRAGAQRARAAASTCVTTAR